MVDRRPQRDPSIIDDIRALRRIRMQEAAAHTQRSITALRVAEALQDTGPTMTLEEFANRL